MAIVEQQRETTIDLTGDVRRRRREALVKAVFFGVAAISILISIAIVLALIGKAWAFLTSDRARSAAGATVGSHDGADSISWRCSFTR